MNERGLNNENLAKLLNVDPSRISNLLRSSSKKGSRSIGKSVLSDLCKVLVVDESEFYKADNIHAFQTQRVYGPYHITEWDELNKINQSSKWMLRENQPIYLTKPAGLNTFGLEVLDDKMEPRFLKGDIILVDPDAKIESGVPWVIKIDDQIVLRVYNEFENEIRLKTLNIKNPDIVFSKNSEVKYVLIGKVVDIIPKL